MSSRMVSPPGNKVRSGATGVAVSSCVAGHRNPAYGLTAVDGAGVQPGGGEQTSGTDHEFGNLICFRVDYRVLYVAGLRP